MGETGDRMDRAGRYVLGLMDDEERERAERDLEIDPAFREALLTVAERMHVFDHPPPADGAPEDGWRLLKEHIDSMPQMRPAPAAAERAGAPSEPAEPRATFGRRRSDRLPGAPVPAAPAKPLGIGLHALPGHRALVLALCLIAAFVLGYVVGRL